MKKILSTIISVSMIAASAAVPVMADYTAPEESYDVEQFNDTFDNGSAENAVDGSAAKQITGHETVRKVDNTDIFTKEFYLSFDFRFDTVDGAVPGYIAINNIKSNGSNNKVGPTFSYDGTNLRTQTGSNSYQSITAISPDTWYTAELEGKMVVVGGKVKMTVYDSGHNVVGSVAELNLRQFYAGAANGNPNAFVAANVSIDNLKFISENPDEFRLSSTADEINAGSNAALDYEAYRLDTLVTKHAVTWSVEGTGVEIDDTGKLIADISAPEQTATVTASATFGDKTLTGTKEIVIHAVDTGDEKFDTIVVSGDDTVKAGGTASFTFTASKGGEDVTDSVTTDDVVWSVYNTDDLAPNNNVNIKAENGTLTVADGVIPQTVYVHASSVSGNVTGSKAVAIGWSDNQKENVIYSNACETAVDNTTRVESVDGSTAYYTEDTTTFQYGNHGEYTLTEMDIKFGNVDGALAGGFRFRRADGTENSSFVINSGSFSQQTGGSKFSVLYSGVEADTWYHMQILYSAGETGSINIYKYNEDGSMELVQTVKGINKRNSKDTGKIEVQGHTYIDNIKVTNPIADAVAVTSPGQYMFAGETAQYTVTATRSGMPLDGAAGVKWSVLDADMLPIIDGTVTIDDTGLLTVNSMAPAQKVTVVASTATSSDKAEMNIQVAEIFSVSNIGINEAGDKIVKLYVDKNFYYPDDVVFVIAIKDADGVLKGVKTVQTFGDRLALGSNELNAELDIPSGFDPETWKIETMVWTMF